MADKNEIMVSVICNTYNHEKYIAQALDSFIMQQTSFRFEILVHDDASTDGTVEIVQRYEKAYPELIFPIYQTENQYSQGIDSYVVFQYPRARGKYIAYCEGDDYWLTPDKLQRQVDYLEAHPEAALCICNAKTVATDRSEVGEVAPVQTSGVVPAEDVIRIGGGFCATSSVVTRRELMTELPDYFNILSLDLVNQMYLASCGTTYCFADYMCAYRVGVANSWSTRMSAAKEQMDAHCRKSIAVRKAFDEETNYRYHDAVLERIFMLYWDLEDFEELQKQEYAGVYKSLDQRTKLRFQIQKNFPRVYRCWRKARYGR